MKESIWVDAVDEMEAQGFDLQSGWLSAHFDWVNWNLDSNQDGIFFSTGRPLAPTIAVQYAVPEIVASFQATFGQEMIRDYAVSDDWATMPTATWFDRVRDWGQSIVSGQGDGEWGEVVHESLTTLEFVLAAAGCDRNVDADAKLEAAIETTGEGSTNLTVFGSGVTQKRSYGVKITRSVPIVPGRAVEVFVGLPYHRRIQSWRPVSGSGEWFPRTVYEPPPLIKKSKSIGKVQVDRGDRPVSLDSLMDRIESFPSKIEFSVAGATDAVQLFRESSDGVTIGRGGDKVGGTIQAKITARTTGTLELTAKSKGTIWQYRPDDVSVVVSTEGRE